MGERDRSPGPLRYRLWAGGLDQDITPEEVRRKMERFGDVTHVSIRSSARDTFAFVQFTNDQAIEDSITYMDNSTSLGQKVRVARATEDRKSNGNRRPPQRDDSRAPPPRGGGGRNDYQDERCDYRGGHADSRGAGQGQDRAPPPRNDYREDSREYQRGSRCEREQPRGGGYSPPPRFYERKEEPRDDRRENYRDDRRDDHRDDRRDDRRDPRGDDWRERDRGERSRSPRNDGGVVRMAGKVPMGRYKITVEHIPEDMSWLELKDLGRDFGPSLTFARTYRYRGNWYGMLEFKDRTDAERVIRELDNRRVQGSNERLRAYMGPGPGGD